MKEFCKKFLSRKFLATLVPMIAGIIVLIFGHEKEVAVIAAAVLEIVPAVAYCFIEGKIDAESVKTATNAAHKMTQKLHASKEICDIVEKAGDVVETAVENFCVSDIDKTEGT